MEGRGGGRVVELELPVRVHSVTRGFQSPSRSFSWRATADGGGGLVDVVVGQDVDRIGGGGELGKMER